MNPVKTIGALLIVAGVLGLAFGGFSFTKETQQAKIGPLELSIKEKETIDIPLWASIAAIVAGAGLIFIGGKKS